MRFLKKYSLAKCSLLKKCFVNFKKERMLFGLTILNVKLTFDDNVILDTLVTGIKNQIIQYTPEELVFNDHLLMEFSPCDVRAITYLSFRKHLNFDSKCSILIQAQKINAGKTIFIFLDKFNGVTFEKTAIQAYQDYELLNLVSKKDMINVISTAVQEQAFQDHINMG